MKDPAPPTGFSKVVGTVGHTDPQRRGLLDLHGRLDGSLGRDPRRRASKFGTVGSWLDDRHGGLDGGRFGTGLTACPLS